MEPEERGVVRVIIVTRCSRWRTDAEALPRRPSETEGVLLGGTATSKLHVFALKNRAVTVDAMSA